MKESYIKEIQRNMQLQSTEELHKMLDDHDTGIWEEEAFEAARRTLKEREEEIPKESKSIKQSPQTNAYDGKTMEQKQGPLHGESRRLTAEPRQVLILDFNMPFWSIVRFMIKFVLAAIPAMIILIVIFAVFFAIFGGLLATIFNLR